MICRGCGKSTGLSGALCLPCRAGKRGISREAGVGPFQVLCRRCGEPLSDVKSRRRGYGPTCWVLVQVESG